MATSQTVFAQTVGNTQIDGRQNVITTAVPFLLISPDARSAGLGDGGLALTPDANSIHWNPAKLAFVEKNGGVALSYTPWLRQLVPDVSLSYLSAYGRLNKRSTFGGSMRYFSLGQIQFTDQFGESLGNFTPNEFAVDLAYATQLSDRFSLGIALRFIYSNLAGNTVLQGGNTTRAGTAGAGDVSAYYKNSKKVSGYKIDYAYGATISNIGSKITYTSSTDRNFIPINLRLGGYASTDLDEFNSLGIVVDFNKLLVPTNPVYETDENGNFVFDPNTSQPVIKEGKDPNVPVIAGMLQSFSDAPRGFEEEVEEINYSIGLEYWYDKQFAVRGGYFNEPETKGNRKYLTFGAGIRYQVFGLDIAYLVPFQQRHPLENTLRFTLHFDFDAFKSQNQENKNKKRVPARRR